MPDSDLSPLKQAAQQVSDSRTQQEKIEALTRAFQLFSKETTRLEEAYQRLQDDLKAVNSSLEKTNLRLRQKVVDLDITTQYLKNILGNMAQGLLFVNGTDTITTYNRAAEEMLGHPGAEVLFKPFKECFKDDIFGFSVSEALAKHHSQPPGVILWKTANGESREYEVEAHYVSKQDGANQLSHRDEYLDYTQGLIILLRDVTEVQRLRCMSEHNDRMKQLGEMAALVAHEIRNPLGGIKGFASLLKRDLTHQPELQQMATYIVEGTDNLGRMVTHVLNYARPVHLSPEPTDLVTLLQDLVSSVRLDEKLSLGIQYVLDLQVPSLVVSVDPHQLRSALLNLVVNGVQAMPEGGEIKISLQSGPGFVIITVTDKGVGIPPENLEKIFTPFFTTKPEGTGFGLTEALKVMQAHGGSLQVSSVVNQGTTITIKLPKPTTQR